MKKEVTIHVIYLTMSDMEHYRTYRILPRDEVFSKDMSLATGKAKPPVSMATPCMTIGDSYADFYRAAM
jgi:hypothetical protein